MMYSEKTADEAVLMTPKHDDIGDSRLIFLACQPWFINTNGLKESSKHKISGFLNNVIIVVKTRSVNKHISRTSLSLTNGLPDCFLFLRESYLLKSKTHFT